jgi:hypothetical protein
MMMMNNIQFMSNRLLCVGSVPGTFICNVLLHSALRLRCRPLVLLLLCLLPPPSPQSLASILKKPGVRKKPYLVRGHDEVLTAARNITSDSLAPIFLTSAVTGERRPAGGRQPLVQLQLALRWCLGRAVPARPAVLQIVLMLAVLHDALTA